MAHVVVLGGGFGGLAGATELRDLLGPQHQITVVDRDPSFAMGFAKLWDLSGQRPLTQGTRSRRDLERMGVTFLQADITEIDPAARTVSTSQGRLEADGLLVALGVQTAQRHREMLRTAGGHSLYEPAELPAMREALAGVTSGRVVVSILGVPHRCPPAPFEAALIVDRILRDRGVRDEVEVAMTTPAELTLPVAGPDASRFVADRVVAQGVDLRAGRSVADLDGQAREIRFTSGERLGFDVLLGVGAETPPTVVTDSPLSGDAGWIWPDPETLATGFERVYAVGDATAVPTPGGQLPKAGVFAAGEAVVAARNLAADLGLGQRDRFDGYGYCFLEVPDQRVGLVEGDFFGPPEQITLSEPDHETWQRKHEYERVGLERWLGPA